MDGPRPIDEVLETVRQGDIMLLYIPTWVQTCVSHHGIDHFVGFYQGVGDKHIRVGALSRGNTKLYIPIDDVDGARIIQPDSELKPVKYFCSPMFEMETMQGDCLLLHHKENKKVVGFYCGHGILASGEDCAVDLSLSRKRPYMPETKIDKTESKFSDLTGFQNIDRFMLDPDHDGIDSILVDLLADHPSIMDRCVEGEYKRQWKQEIIETAGHEGFVN